MKRALGLWGLLGLSLCVVVTLTPASEPPVEMIEQERVPGGLKKLAKGHDPVYHYGPPAPIDPVPIDPSGASHAKLGPVGSSDPGAGVGGGSIVAPRGGAVFTAKQRADREIDRLIRRLR